MVGPIDKELLGEEAEINKLEITTFEQARVIKEQEANLEVLQRDAEEEEQTGIFDVKVEMVETKVTRRERWSSRRRYSERRGPGQDRAGGRTRSRPSLLKHSRWSGGLISRLKST